LSTLGVYSNNGYAQTKCSQSKNYFGATFRVNGTELLKEKILRISKGPLQLLEAPEDVKIL